MATPPATLLIVLLFAPTPGVRSEFYFLFGETSLVHSHEFGITNILRNRSQLCNGPTPSSLQPRNFFSCFLHDPSRPKTQPFCTAIGAFKFSVFGRTSFVTERNPRLFYVSSATSTSLATTQCYIPNTDVCNCVAAGCDGNNNPTGCPTCAFTPGKRRRRALPDDVDLVDQVDDATDYKDSFQRWEVIQMYN